jgi:outer membrane protein assembly factor BamA
MSFKSIFQPSNRNGLINRKNWPGKLLALSVLIILDVFVASGQTDSTAKKDSLSGFDKFNKKAEALFKIIPVPIISYSSDAGNIFGLAKFNLIHLSKKDTISKPSKLSEVVTFSTKGRINASIATELVFDENKYVVIGFFNYRKQPEYIFGIGNDVSIDSVEQVQYDRIRFVASGLRLFAKNLYAGISVDVSNYFDIEPDSNSFLKRQNVTGLNGGLCLGLGFSLAYDSRDNRYNPSKGTYVISNYLFYSKSLGSAYQFNEFSLDARQFFNPWLKHVIAIQATTTNGSGDVPFFEMAMLGGDSRMRGYYEGAYRDKVAIDGQLEYRMPVWNIFGLTAFIAGGQVGSSYGRFSLNGFHPAYGGGLRIRVDSKNNTNMRFDMGFGPQGIKAFYLNFAEAF